ncbi:hypothetical protein [Paenibacillus sp. 453mf]|uniref:hypothetical protein n=1 Tax=Paenibacillus sp. 453mf TaxID=1761874 RepID=UPI000AD810E6|nr:hypothetical protein [Paenibacillus sp. 453mf]
MGWDERNGGNISSMLEEHEIKDFMDIHQPLRIWKPDFGQLDSWRSRILGGNCARFYNIDEM